MEEKGIGAEGVRIMKDQDLAYVRMMRLKDRKKIEMLQGSLHYLEGGGGDDDDEDGGETYSSTLKKMVGKKRKHTIFVEGGKNEAENFDAAKHFGTIPELMGRAFNRPRIETLEKQLGTGKILQQNADYDYYNDESDDNGNDFNGERNSIKGQQQLSEKQLLKKKRKQRRLERKVAKSRSAAYSEMELRIKRLKKLENAEAHLMTEKHIRGKGRKRKVLGKEDGKPSVYKWRRKRSK